MTEKEKCYLDIDWDAVWKDVTIKRKFDYSRTKSHVQDIEQILTKYINTSITTLTNNYTISNNTKLEVIKEIYYKEKEYNQSASINAIKNIRVITSLGLKEAKDIVDVWKEEYTATKTKEV